MKYISYYLKKILIGVIKIYQKTLSFDHSPLKVFYPHGFCRFNPTCSQYSIEAINKYGPIKGSIKAIWRILKCNPFNKGGNDPLK
jgi:putative membrane protein insertion efficiency factor